MIQRKKIPLYLVSLHEYLDNQKQDKFSDDEEQPDEPLIIDNIRFRFFHSLTKNLLEKHFTTLKILTISHCDLRNLENFPWLRHLQILNLGFNQIQGGFNNIMPCKRLRYLNIESNIVLQWDKLKPLKRIKSQKLIDVCVKNNPFWTNQKQTFTSMIKSLKAYNVKPLKQPKQPNTINSSKKGGKSAQNKSNSKQSNKNKKSSSNSSTNKKNNDDDNEPAGGGSGNNFMFTLASGTDSSIILQSSSSSSSEQLANKNNNQDQANRINNSNRQNGFSSNANADNANDGDNGNRQVADEMVDNFLSRGGRNSEINPSTSGRGHRDHNRQNVSGARGMQSLIAAHSAQRNSSSLLTHPYSHFFGSSTNRPAILSAERRARLIRQMENDREYLNISRRRARQARRERERERERALADSDPYSSNIDAIISRHRRNGLRAHGERLQYIMRQINQHRDRSQQVMGSRINRVANDYLNQHQERNNAMRINFSRFSASEQGRGQGRGYSGIMDVEDRDRDSHTVVDPSTFNQLEPISSSSQIEEFYSMREQQQRPFRERILLPPNRANTNMRTFQIGVNDSAVRRDLHNQHNRSQQNEHQNVENYGDSSDDEMIQMEILCDDNNNNNIDEEASEDSEEQEEREFEEQEEDNNNLNQQEEEEEEEEERNDLQQQQEDDDQDDDDDD